MDSLCAVSLTHFQQYQSGKLGSIPPRAKVTPMPRLTKFPSRTETATMMEKDLDAFLLLFARPAAPSISSLLHSLPLAARATEPTRGCVTLEGRLASPTRATSAPNQRRAPRPPPPFSSALASLSLFLFRSLGLIRFGK